MPWGDFADRAKAYLDGTPKPIELAYKISGETGKPVVLAFQDDFETAMERVCTKAVHARTKAVSIEVKNLVSCF